MINAIEQRHTLEIAIFVLSENAESIIISSSLVSPKGTQLRLPKRKEKGRLYVTYLHRRVYERNWMRVAS